MSRRKRSSVRIIAPDPIYSNLLVAKYTNFLMWDGKKTIASSIVYKALDYIQEKINDGSIIVEPGQGAVDVLEIATNNVSPSVEVKPRRVGGANYQVPVDVSSSRGMTLAIRWVVSNARKRGKDMFLALARELIDSYNNTGASVKKKDDTHRMAEANKAFAHFRW